MLTDSQRKNLERATSRYELAFLDEAEEYVRARGLTPETAAGFRLGVVSDPDVEHEPVEGMLSIPYLIKGDAPVELRFRCMESHDCKALKHGKYRSLAGAQTRMFNVRDLLKPGPDIHIAEGEFDTMILSQCGYNAVGIPGANIWQAHYPVLLAGYNQVYVWADGDEAGTKLQQTIQNAVRGSTVPLRLPRGADVNSIYLDGGADALRDILEAR